MDTTVHTIDAHNFKCPFCHAPFEEDDLQELCGEPFNGTILICPGCDREWIADVAFTLILDSEPEEDEDA